jgi:hypothetical protein
MPADKLGKYMHSPEFLRRAQKAIERAVADLEAKGLKPVYDRDPPASDVRNPTTSNVRKTRNSSE